MSIMSAPSLAYYLRFDEGDEVRELQEISVEGTIPTWVEGTLLRNGSNVYQVGKTTFNHLFDGMAVLHKYVIKDGKVRYQSRILDSKTWKDCQRAQCLISRQFGTGSVPDPCKNIFSRYISFFFKSPPADNTGVNVVSQGDRLLAFTEFREVTIVDPDSLTRTDSVDISEVVSVRTATAHPIQEEDGTVYNLGTNLIQATAYNIIKVPPKSEAVPEPLLKAEILTSIPSRWPNDIGYNHSFGATPRHFIVLEQTTTLNRLNILLAMFSGGAIQKCMRQKQDEPNMFHVINKHDGKRLGIRFVCKSFFSFHFVNCFEEGDLLVVDLIVYEKGNILEDLYLHTLQYNLGKLDEDPPQYWRFVLPLNVDKAEKGDNLVTMTNTTATAVKQEDGSIFLTPEKMFPESPDVQVELPRINAEKYSGVRHRFAYGTAFINRKSKLSKVDLETRQVKQWYQHGIFAGEPVFVSAPNATKEDEGVVLSSCWSERGDNQGFLVVLDASSFQELGRAVLPPGHKVPISYHGTFVPPQ